MGREQEAAGPCDDVLDSLSTPFVMVNGQTGERTLPLLDLITVVARWDGYCSTRGSSIINTEVHDQLSNFKAKFVI